MEFLLGFNPIQEFHGVWYIRDIGTTKIFVVYEISFFAKFCFWFFLMVLFFEILFRRVLYCVDLLVERDQLYWDPCTINSPNFSIKQNTDFFSTTNILVVPKQHELTLVVNHFIDKRGPKTHQVW